MLSRHAIACMYQRRHLEHSPKAGMVQNKGELGAGEGTAAPVSWLRGGRRLGFSPKVNRISQRGSQETEGVWAGEIKKVATRARYQRRRRGGGGSVTGCHNVGYAVREIKTWWGWREWGAPKRPETIPAWLSLFRLSLSLSTAAARFFQAAAAKADALSCRVKHTTIMTGRPGKNARRQSRGLAA